MYCSLKKCICMMWLKLKVGLYNKCNFEKLRNYNNEYWVYFIRFFCNIWYFYWRFVLDKLLISNYYIYIRGVIDSVVIIFIIGGFLFYVMFMFFKMIKIFCYMIWL